MSSWHSGISLTHSLRAAALRICAHCYVQLTPLPPSSMYSIYSRWRLCMICTHVVGSKLPKDCKAPSSGYGMANKYYWIMSAICPIFLPFSSVLWKERDSHAGSKAGLNSREIHLLVGSGPACTYCLPSVILHPLPDHGPQIHSDPPSRPRWERGWLVISWKSGTAFGPREKPRWGQCGAGSCSSESNRA